MDAETSNLLYEDQCISRGYRLIAGVDEVGMGCLAGPVVAGAVILDRSVLPPGITDSKQLTQRQRERLETEIRSRALAVAIGIADVEEIDRLNILRAAQLAMCRAIEALPLKPDFLLVDGKYTLSCPHPQRAIIQGDRLSVSIGAASILAKVFRDRLMGELDVQYPGYGFASHKGYGSVAHRRSLQEKGPTPLHRKSFSWTPV